MFVRVRGNAMRKCLVEDVCSKFILMLLFVTLVDEMKDMMRRMKAGNGALITPIRLCIALLNTRRAVK